MTQLETIKGKTVEIPRLVKRYAILFYDNWSGWRCEMELHVNPEGAVQSFLERMSKYPNENVKYYKVVELDVEIPFVPKDK